MRRFWTSVRLGDVGSSRNNNLTFIRLLLASTVIFSHCYVLLSQYPNEPFRRTFKALDFGWIAVVSFFFLSGYLITQSALKTDKPESFLRNRALRLFPGLATVVAFSALILGPMVSSLSLRAYFADASWFSYFLRIGLHPHPDMLPGVFSSSPSSAQVNVPLWSLASEWTMYLAALIACTLARPRRLLTWKPASFVALLAAIAFTAQMFPLPYPQDAIWALFFLMGSLAYVFRDRVVLSPPLAVCLLAITLALLAAGVGAGKVLFPAALAYVLLTFGFHPALHLRACENLGDYSYGLYIYGWPIQQTLLTGAKIHSPMTLFFASYPLALLAAILSWHFIESRCLALKSRPSRDGNRAKEQAMAYAGS